jgi:glycosyltransferase involved in cell wall biosynthesis
MATFSHQVAECCAENFEQVGIITANDLEGEGAAVVIKVPRIVTMTQAISRLRPLFWFFYSHLCLSRVNGRVFSTTAHPIPGVKEQILCLYDVRPYFFPDGFLQKAYSRFVLPRNLRQCAGIVTISDESKRQIVSVYNVPPNQVHVVPLYVDLGRFTPRSEIRASENMARNYLLMVGATWKHKNAEEVLLNSSCWSDSYDLKIVAGDSRYRRKLVETVYARGLHGRVTFLEYVSQSELIALYQGASALIYPSTMEGFGIPPLEAMACGIPTILSDIPLFRDMYGAGALYVKLGNQESWRTAFQALGDERLVSNIVETGAQTARSYTRSRMHNALLNAITSVWPELRPRRYIRGEASLPDELCSI